MAPHVLDATLPLLPALPRRSLSWRFLHRPGTIWVFIMQGVRILNETFKTLSSPAASASKPMAILNLQLPTDQCASFCGATAAAGSAMRQTLHDTPDCNQWCPAVWQDCGLFCEFRPPMLTAEFPLQV